MYTIQKEWKEVNVSVSQLEVWLRANFPSLVGCSANSKCEMHFTIEPSEEEKSLIDTYWDSLDGSDYVDAITLALKEQELESAIITMKETIITKTWDQMSAIERKVAIGLKPTRAEMGLE